MMPRVTVDWLQTYVQEDPDVDAFKAGLLYLVEVGKKFAFGYPSGGIVEYDSFDRIPFPVNIMGSTTPEVIMDELGVCLESDGNGCYRGKTSIGKISFPINYWFEDEIGGSPPD